MRKFKIFLLFYIAHIAPILQTLALKSEECLQKVNWCSISHLYKRRVLSLMHQIYYNQTDSRITERFQRNNRTRENSRRQYQFIKFKHFHLFHFCLAMVIFHKFYPVYFCLPAIIPANLTLSQGLSSYIPTSISNILKF